MNRYDFTAILKSQGCGDSATQPKTAQMLLCRRLHFLSFLQRSRIVSFTSQQPVLQKLVPKCQKIPTEHGSKYASPVQSCRMSIFSHPVQISQYGESFTPPMLPTLGGFTPLTPNNKSQELWSMEKRKPRTNETEKDARVLTSVYFLSYHSLKLLSNSIKKRQNRSIPVDIF